MKSIDPTMHILVFKMWTSVPRYLHHVTRSVQTQMVPTRARVTKALLWIQRATVVKVQC